MVPIEKEKVTEPAPHRVIVELLEIGAEGRGFTGTETEVRALSQVRLELLIATLKK